MRRSGFFLGAILLVAVSVSCLAVRAEAAATAVTISITPGSPQPTGVVAVFQAQASGGSGLYEYKFQRKLTTDTQWTTVRAYRLKNTCRWNTTGVPAGDYRVRVLAREEGSSARFEARNSIGFTLTVPVPATAVSLRRVPKSPSVTGNPVTFTALASGGNGIYQYRYLWKRATDAIWTLGRDFSTLRRWTWNTTVLPPGEYRVRVVAHTVDTPNSSNVRKTVTHNLIIGAGTVLFHEDWNSGSINPDDWDLVDATSPSGSKASVVNGELVIQAWDDWTGGSGVISTAVYPNGTKVQYDFTIDRVRVYNTAEDIARLESSAGSIALRGGNDLTRELIVRDSLGTDYSFGTYEPGQWYSLEVVADVNKTTLTLNGITFESPVVLSDYRIGFGGSVEESRFDELWVTVPTELFSEDWSSGAIDPSDWGLVDAAGPGGSKASVINEELVIGAWDDWTGGSGVTSTALYPVGTRVTYDFAIDRIRVFNARQSIASLESSTGSIVLVGGNDSNKALLVRDSLGTDYSFGTYVPGQWYSLEVIAGVHGTTITINGITRRSPVVLTGYRISFGGQVEDSRFDNLTVAVPTILLSEDWTSGTINPADWDLVDAGDLGGSKASVVNEELVIGAWNDWTGGSGVISTATYPTGAMVTYDFAIDWIRVFNPAENIAGIGSPTAGITVRGGNNNTRKLIVRDSLGTDYSFGTYVPGQWYSLEVVAGTNGTTITLNGITLQSPVVLSGYQISFGGQIQNTRFDNVRVEE